MQLSEVFARARSAIGTGVRYKLGAGGVDPHAKSPADASHQCDCSGFVCWTFGLSRQSHDPFFLKINGGWINTDSMVADANAAGGIFTRIPRAIPGCTVVYPKDALHDCGHVALVTEVNDATGHAHKIIHCSHGNDRAYSDAIQETDPHVFNTPDAIYGWLDGLQ